MIPVSRPAHRSKPEVALEGLRGVARRLGPGAKFPALRELRDQLGVSLPSLDLALNTLEKEGLIERRERVGIFVSSATKRAVPRIAIVVDPNFSRGAYHSPFWDLFVGRIGELSEAEQYRLSLQFGTLAKDWKNEVQFASELRESLEAGRWDGVITVGLGDASVEWLEERHIPCATCLGPGNVSVNFDLLQIARLGISAVQQCGARRVALWEAAVSGRAATERFLEIRPKVTAQICALWEEVGLKFEADLWHSRWELLPHVGAKTDISMQEQGYHRALQVFRGPRVAWPDGLVFDNDLYAHGALMALDRLGIVPGRDLPMASLSNAGSPTLLGREHQIIRVENDPRGLLDVAFELLEFRLRGQKPDPSQILLSPQLLWPDAGAH